MVSYPSTSSIWEVGLFVVGPKTKTRTDLSASRLVDPILRCLQLSIATSSPCLRGELVVTQLSPKNAVPDQGASWHKACPRCRHIIHSSLVCNNSIFSVLYLKICSVHPLHNAAICVKSKFRLRVCRRELQQCTGIWADISSTAAAACCLNFRALMAEVLIATFWTVCWCVVEKYSNSHCYVGLESALQAFVKQVCLFSA